MTGLPIPKSNYFKVPDTFWDLDLTSVQRIVMLYIIRHTWGFHEYGITKRITIDEFQNGRKYANGNRMDKGTGLSRGAISQSLNELEQMGFIQVDKNDNDKARIKKSYCLVIQSSPDERRVREMNAEFTEKTRSEKDTMDRYSKKEETFPVSTTEKPSPDWRNERWYAGYEYHSKVTVPKGQDTFTYAIRLNAVYRAWLRALEGNGKRYAKNDLELFRNSLQSLRALVECKVEPYRVYEYVNAQYQESFWKDNSNPLPITNVQSNILNWQPTTPKAKDNAPLRFERNIADLPDDRLQEI